MNTLSNFKPASNETDFSLKQLEPSLTPTGLTAQAFTGFFPYGWQFIYATATDKPNWKTETKYPITQRRLFDLWEDPDRLIGVRFGTKTGYGMLDVDLDSPYHPSQSDRLFRGILLGLEDIGLVRPIIVQSSFSKGLHVYYPLAEVVPSFGLACAIKSCLKSHGYEIAQGVLEIFPHTKSFDSEYNAHRLPLQSGSYLLDDDLQIASRDLTQFVSTWLAQAQDQDLELLRDSIEVAKSEYEPPKDSRKAIGWRDDLEKQIQQGWTGKGQSDALLLKMGELARVFMGCSTPESIADYIVKTARAAVGFVRYCGDIARLEHKARDVAKWCFEYRFPWGERKKQTESEVNPMTKKAEKQAERTDRICSAIDRLNESGEMPITVRGMAASIAGSAHVSVRTLYEQRGLWHPEFKMSGNSPGRETSDEESPISQEQPDRDESQSGQAVTENPLYEALEIPDSPLRVTQTSKFAEMPFQPPADRIDRLAPVESIEPETPKKSVATAEIDRRSELGEDRFPPMWADRAKFAKNRSSDRGVDRNTATGSDCYKPYVPVAEVFSPLQIIRTRIAALKTSLLMPFIRGQDRSKREAELKNLEDSIAQL